MNIVERQLQLNLNKVNKWARENGFKFSKSKTKCVHFCSLRKMHNDPLLKIDDSEIPVINEYIFLGIIFDKKLSFIPHIKYLKNKSTRAQQLLRVVAHTEWGADRQTLIKLYRTLLRSQLDYGIFVYRSARKSYLKQLDPIHHGSLRLVLGAFRTSPIDSLYTEAHEAPLQSRSEKLALQYYTKLKSSPPNPAYDCTFDPKYRKYFDQKEKSIRPFGLRMEAILKKASIPLDNIHKSTLPQIPPWIIKNPKVNLQLNQPHKTKTHPFTYQEKHQNILQQYPNYLCIYTDGSKDHNKTARAAVLNKIIKTKALPMDSSIFTAEACAIDLALDIISKEKHKKFIIFSDSLSVLLSLNNKKLEHPLIVKLLCRLHSTLNKEIVFCWIPSHIGVRGNHRADAAAKSALDLTPEKYNIPYTDLKLKINNFLHKKWQQRWNRNTSNKLFQVKPFLGEWHPAFRKSRKEQVTITRLRIGHSRLTHSFILKQEQQPQCLTCQTPCTIKHVLLECKVFNDTRKHYFHANSMKDLFENVHMDNVLSFLKETGLYQKI